MTRPLFQVLWLALTLASFVARASGDTRAAELLAQARAAVGGDARLSKVQGLSCNGTAQRLIGDRQVEGELTLDLQLPDKLWRVDAISPMGDSTILVAGQGLNGERLLRSSHIENAPPGAMIRTMQAPPAGSDAEAQALRAAKAELTRLTLVLLLNAPSSMPLEFVSAGQAESPDGKADVLDVRGPGSFAARLFLDASSHRPLMLTYRGVAPRTVINVQRGPRPAEGHGGPPAPDNPSTSAPQNGDLVDIAIFLDDYRDVDGVLMPHHISRSIDGKPSEDWTFKTVALNPVFKADAFSGK